MSYGTVFLLSAPQVFICKLTCFKVNRKLHVCFVLLLYLNSSLADGGLFEYESLSSFRPSVCMHSLIYEAKYQSVFYECAPLCSIS
jgi:hypothetical protein